MNRRGTWALFGKEVRRFSKVWVQTVMTPLVSTSLYFVVFGVALGGRLRTVAGVPYVEFVVPGLIVLATIHNAYSNTSSSFLQAKMNGTIDDVLVAPLSSTEILVAYVAAATVRALVVGGLVWGVAACFVGVRLESPLLAAAIVLAVAATSAALGLLAAVRAERFDQVSAIPGFVLTPLVFLGGVFYSLDMLEEPWASVSRANPVLYLVGALRRAMLGSSHVDLGTALAVVIGLLALSSGAALRSLERSPTLRP